MRCDEIGVKVSKEEFVSFLNGVQPGQFFSIKGYVNEKGEKADRILRFGVKYANIKEHDAKVLRAILSGERREVFGIVHGVWIPAARIPALFLDATQIAAFSEERRAELVEVTLCYEKMIDGMSFRAIETGTVDPMDVFTFSNKEGGKNGGKIAVTMSYRLPSTHSLVMAAIGAPDLDGTLLKSIESPAQATSDYVNEARSCFSREKEGEPDRWYIRDVLEVQKTVRIPAEAKFTASFPINAVKDTIEQAILWRGKYRQFKLTDGQFESITIEGQAILVDGINEEFYFALPQAVKEAAMAEAM